MKLLHLVVRQTRPDCMHNTHSTSQQIVKLVIVAAVLLTSTCIWHILNKSSALFLQTGGAPTEEDQDRVKACVMEAKGLFPKNEEVLMLEAEAAAAEGMFDDALAMMQNVIKSADPTDSMPIIIQANILMQKVKMKLMQSYIRTYKHT